MANGHETNRQRDLALEPHVDKNDSVLIIGVTKDYAGWLPPKAWEWIKERQAVAA